MQRPAAPVPSLSAGTPASSAPAPASTLPAPPRPPERESTSFIGLYRALWHYARGARALLLLSSTLLVGSQLVKLAVPWLAAQAIDTLQDRKSVV